LKEEKGMNQSPEFFFSSPAMDRHWKRKIDEDEELYPHLEGEGEPKLF
jgi:hypothetical protein